MMHRRQAVGQDAATDHKHGDGADDRQRFHQIRRGAHDTATDGARQRAAFAAQIQPQIVQPDDAGDDAVHAERHHDGDAAQDDHLLAEGGAGDRAQRDGDNLGGEHEVGAYCAFHLALLIGRGVLIGAGPVRFFLLRRLAVAQAVKHLFEPFVTQVGAAHHQQRRNRPGCKSADQQRQRHQDCLVDQRTFGDAPHHR